jgi:hypothetical protein
MDEALVEVRYLAGRCANGAERDKGTLYHAVPSNSSWALCGRTFGRMSAGWSDMKDHPITCPRCQRRLDLER